MQTIAWVGEAIRTKLAKLLDTLDPPLQLSTVTSQGDLAGRVRRGAVVFLDSETIEKITDETTLESATVIVIGDESLPAAISLLPKPWVNHVIGESLLDLPMAPQHIRNVMSSLDGRKVRLMEWLPSRFEGRRINLRYASRRAERIEKMASYLEEKGVGARTTQQLRDAAEELLTNAFYDAPAAAGVFEKPVSRTEDIALPEDSPCDLGYGVYDDLALVRVRDPFGSLQRKRLVDVLTRCSTSDGSVVPDESMGGAGLGMWRLFSTASFVAISVARGRRTEILVGYAKRSPGKKPFAFHLYFRDSSKKLFWRLFNDDTKKSELDKSVILVTRP